VLKDVRDIFLLLFDELGDGGCDPDSCGVFFVLFRSSVFLGRIVSGFAAELIGKTGSGIVSGGSDTISSIVCGTCVGTSTGPGSAAGSSSK
jgi:hypothetical protein